MIWQKKESNDTKNLSLNKKRRIVEKLLIKWSNLLDWNFDKFQRVNGYRDWDNRIPEDSGFEIINLVIEGRKHLSIVIKNPSFMPYIMVTPDSVVSSYDDSTNFDCEIGLPDFIKSWAFDWVINNSILLEDIIKNEKLSDLKERWGQNFIEDLNVDEATLYKSW